MLDPSLVEFPHSVIERLGFTLARFVIRDCKVFYVGKAMGDRVFAHPNEAIKQPTATERVDRR